MFASSGDTGRAFSFVLAPEAGVRDVRGFSFPMALILTESDSFKRRRKREKQNTTHKHVELEELVGFPPLGTQESS